METLQGIAYSVNGAEAGPRLWVEGWVFRQGYSLLTFSRSTNDGPATELRFDTGGGHFKLRRE